MMIFNNKGKFSKLVNELKILIEETLVSAAYYESFDEALVLKKIANKVVNLRYSNKTHTRNFQKVLSFIELNEINNNIRDYVNTSKIANKSDLYKAVCIHLSDELVRKSVRLTIRDIKKHLQEQGEYYKTPDNPKTIIASLNDVQREKLQAFLCTDSGDSLEAAFSIFFHTCYIRSYKDEQ